MDFFTIAIEFTVIGFGILSAIDMGSRLGFLAAGKAIAPTAPRPDSAKPAPATFAPIDVVTTGYIGDMQEIEPAPEVDALSSEADYYASDWDGTPVYDSPMDGWIGVSYTRSAHPTRSRSLSDLIRKEVARPKDGIVAKVDHTFDLPNSIRELRQYIRDNGLQSAIKAQVGKSVSKATKSELIAALGAI